MSFKFLKIFTTLALLTSFFSFAKSESESSLVPFVKSKSESSSMKVALIDIQAAILQTDEGKKAKINLEKDVEKKKKELHEKQNELKKLEEEYQAQQSILSDSDKMMKQKNFQEKLQSFQQSQVKMEQDMRQKEAEISQNIYKGLNSTIDQISKKNDYDFVFDKSSGVIQYAKKVDDITNEVIQVYNKTQGKNKKSEGKTKLLKGSSSSQTK